MSPEESWEHKEGISEAEPVGGSLGGGRPPEESAQEMTEEEEEIQNPNLCLHRQVLLRRNM